MNKDMRLLMAVVSSVFFFCLPLMAEAASSGPNSPAAVVNSNPDSSCLAEWTDATNAAASDDTYATANTSGGCTDFLQVTDFGFSIPGTATITGIEVNIERHQEYGTIEDRNLFIVKGGSRGRTNKADTGVAWPSSDTVKTYGGASDLWDLAWTVDDINDTNFGVVLSAKETSGVIFGIPIYVDHITITVHYTEAASAPSGRGGIPRSLIRLREQNGLDRWGYPISSSSSTTSSSSSTSTEEPIHEAVSVSSAAEDTTSSASSSASSPPGPVAETKDWHWIFDSDPAPAAWIVSFRMRVCERIERWFAPKPVSVLASVLPRLNTRLKNRWGFGCAAPTEER